MSITSIIHREFARVKNTAIYQHFGFIKDIPIEKIYFNPNKHVDEKKVELYLQQLKKGETLDYIKLKWFYDDPSRFYIHDGHHRTTATYLSESKIIKGVLVGQTFENGLKDCLTIDQIKIVSNLEEYNKKNPRIKRRITII